MKRPWVKVALFGADAAAAAVFLALWMNGGPLVFLAAGVVGAVMSVRSFREAVATIGSVEEER